LINSDPDLKSRSDLLTDVTQKVLNQKN